MRKAFQNELAKLEDELVTIARLVEQAISDATAAFKTSDIELAETVADRGSEIEQACNALDETAIDLLARQAPVASDLRLVVTALRISSSFARMSDYALHIANLARHRYPERAIPKGLKKYFVEMGRLDTEIVGRLIVMLREHDPRLLEEIDDVDDQIDELHVRVFEKVLSGRFADDEASIVDATLASRFHERFGDHAVSIAKRVADL